MKNYYIKNNGVHPYVVLTILIFFFANLGRIARVICIARPRYGESSPYLLQNILEYGEIVLKLVVDSNIRVVR
jgi:hypothetical protein